jgi:Cu(I)/Ag(I) efflux system membrane fusion protein
MRLVAMSLALLVPISGLPLIAARATEPAHGPLYYQDPDGKPFYASGPKKTADGREYKPVFEDPTAASGTTSVASTGTRHVLYYRNPMGLPDTSPVPKKDAMGMDYVPVYADEAGGPSGIVRIAPGRLQTLGVRTEQVTLRPALTRTVRATGILQFDERHLATVTTKVTGWIEHLAVAATGDPVRRGQVLAEIYAPDLVAAEEEYLVAARLGGGMAHGEGGALAAASLQRLRALDIPEDEIVRLRKTGKAQRRIAVQATADGVVIEKPAQEGIRIEAGQPLYKTADLTAMWLIAEVQERDLGLIQPGQPATAQFVAFPGRSFAGTVGFIYPALSPETRTGRVRIVMLNPDQVLRAAMYASVEIATPAASGPVLAAPLSAVIDSGKRQVVFIDRGDGRFEPRAVRLGTRTEDWVEVIEGVKAGDKVVTAANFLIDAESNLRAALQGFDGAPAGAPGAAGGKP